MAGAGYKLFNTGDVLTAAQVNTYLMEQTVMVFADAAARTTALTGVVSEGMISYLKDTNAVEVYNGSAWVASDDPNAIQNTIVDAKGDLITATAADTPARLAVGSNGDTLVADSAATTGLRWQSAYNGNAIINGGFDIWQRGTSFTGALGNVYGADRWLINPTTARTFSRQTSGLTGIQYSLRCARNSSSTDTGAIYAIYSMESADSYRFAGQTVTLSYWAKAGANYSSASSALTINWQSGTGTDQNIYTAGYTGSATVLNTSVTLTTSWQRFTHTFSVSSTATEIGGWFTYTPTGTAGSNDWFEVTGIQLELGSVATSFKRAGGTLQGELAAAMRYYEVSGGGSVGRADSTTAVEFGYCYKVPKRTTPSISLTTTAPRVYQPSVGTKTGSGSALTQVVNPTTTGAIISVNGFTGFTSGGLCFTHDTDFLIASAEL